MFPVVTLRSRVGSRNGFRSGVNTRRCPGLGARSRQGGIGIQGAGFFGDGAGAKASRRCYRGPRAFSEFLLIPTDASGAYRPNPQANKEVCRPPFTEGLH